MAGVRVLSLISGATPAPLVGAEVSPTGRARMCAPTAGRRALCAFAVALSLAGCDDGRTRLTVRTDLPDDFRERVEAAFEASNPDVDVRFSIGADADTGTELEGDGDVSFDVWLGGPGVEMERYVRSGRLAGWEPWGSSAFVVVFDRDRVNLMDAPADWIDVLHHGWAEEALVPDPTRSESGAAFVFAAVARAARVDSASYIGFDWLRRIDDQVVRYVPSAEEAIRGVRLGEALLAIVPQYAFEAESDDESTLYHRRPESRDAAVVGGVAPVRADGVGGEAAARFVTFVRSAEELGFPPGWERTGGHERDEIRMVADSASVWMSRWRETVRGRGK